MVNVVWCGLANSLFLENSVLPNEGRREGGGGKEGSHSRIDQRTLIII